MPDAGSLPSKEAAELDLLRAQIEKLDREAQPPPVLVTVTDLVKILGAMILGAGGVTAAITGYQASEVKKERMELAFEKKQGELRALDEQFRQRQADFDKLGADLAALGQVVDTRAAEYSGVVKNVEQVQEQLVALRGDVASTATNKTTTRKLEAAIADVGRAKVSAEKRNDDLGQVRTEIQRLTTMQKKASNKLTLNRDQSMKLSEFTY
jgi:chromosome segregation ATPase